jgi:chitinase
VNLGASWSYDPSSKLFVSYDNKDVVLQKIAYIQGNRLGGAMWWESSADGVGEKSLISTVSVFSVSDLGTNTLGLEWALRWWD